MTDSLLARSIRALSPKKVHRVTGYALGHLYAFMRDPQDPEHPDATGVRDPVERLVSLFEAMATYPSLRPLLREWRLFFEGLFARLLDHHETPASITHGDLVRLAGECAREDGESIAETIAEGDDEKALAETLESIEKRTQLARALQAKIEQDGIRSIARPRPA